VNVLEWVRDFDGFLADFIRRTDGEARLHAAAFAVAKSFLRCAMLLKNS
jgi:hypothetical protein